MTGNAKVICPEIVQNSLIQRVSSKDVPETSRCPLDVSRTYRYSRDVPWIRCAVWDEIISKQASINERNVKQ